MFDDRRDTHEKVEIVLHVSEQAPDHCSQVDHVCRFLLLEESFSCSGVTTIRVVELGQGTVIAEKFVNKKCAKYMKFRGGLMP